MFMHHPQLSFYSAAALVFFLQVTAAVRLEDFTPRASNLPSDCEQLYSSHIDGCESSDFTNGKCSKSCISALTTLSASVKQTCAGDVSEDNIISAMLNNQGVLRVCPNAGDADAGDDASSATSATSSATRSTPTASKQAESESIGTSTMILSADPLSTSGILVDTSSPMSSTSLMSSAAMRTATASTTLTAAPVAATKSSAASSGIDVLHDATTGATAPPEETASSPSATTSDASVDSSSTGGGSPFDSTSGSVRTLGSLSAVLMSFSFGLILLR